MKTALRFGVLLLGVVLCTTTGASAQDAPAPGAVTTEFVAKERASDLGHLLHYYRDHGSHLRRWTGLAGVTVAAVAVPASLLLISRDTERTGAYRLLSVGAAAGTVGLMNLFISVSDFHTLAAHHDARRAKGLPDAQVAAETEAEWAALAADHRSRRTFAGTLGLIGGGVLLATGLVFTLIDLIDPEDFPAQYDIAGVVMAIGGVTFIASSEMLLVENAVETSYRSFVRGHTADTTVTPKVSVAPLRGGGMIAVGARF